MQARLVWRCSSLDSSTTNARKKSGNGFEQFQQRKQFSHWFLMENWLAEERQSHETLRP